MSVQLACLAKLYFRSGGTYEAPTWLEANEVMNLTVSPAWDAADANSRTQRAKFSAKTILGLEITGSIKKKPGDAAYEMILDGLISDDVLDVLCLDGPMDEDGVRGWRADMQVHECPEDQSLGNVLYDDFTLKPYPSHPLKAVLVGGTAGLTYALPGSSTFA